MSCMSVHSMGGTTDSLKRMVSHGKKLKSIQIGMEPESQIELSDYNTMLEIVQSRNLPYALEITMYEGQINVPEDTLSKNSTWLEMSAVDYSGDFSFRID